MAIVPGRTHPPPMGGGDLEMGGVTHQVPLHNVGKQIYY